MKRYQMQVRLSYYAWVDVEASDEHSAKDQALRKAWREMAHRYVASFLGLLIIAIAVAAGVITWPFLPGLPAVIIGVVPWKRVTSTS